MGKKIKIWAAVIAAVLAIIIILQNTASVETKFLFVKVVMPRAVLLIVTLLIGVVMGIGVSSYLTKRKKR